MDVESLPVNRVLARALNDMGVETLFGLMGDSNLFMVDDFVRTYGGRYVPATHEAGAVLMALGHAAMTGEVGVATVTQGPALSNATTPIIEGVKGTLPLVLMSGDTPADDPEHYQAIAQRAVVEATGAGFVPLRGPDSVAEDLAEAFRRARAERRPIVFNMPTPLMWEVGRYTGVVPAPDEARLQPADGPAMENAIGIIAAARTPLILAGRGAIGAREPLLKLAERIGAPVATTLKAKGLFQGADHDLGVFGTLSTPAAAEAIGAADCIISFGAGLNRFTTAWGGYLEGCRLVQVDDMPASLGRRARPDAALVGAPDLVVETMLKWLDEAEIPSSRATDTLDAAALKEAPPLPAATNRAGTVDLSRALQRIDATLDAERVFVTDGGRFCNEAWSRISVTGPRNMLLSTNVAAIGLGMGYAIGAAVARPDQPTLLVTGDGGFMMGGLAEFTSAVREKLDLVVVVCNDNAYGAEYVQFEDRQMDPVMSLFNWPSLADAATALGAAAVQVSSEEDLDKAVETIEGRDGPVLIELILDPANVPRLHI
ncbi:MAG: thiamine pyrophosphate-dependent enzyme [Pseudomonadota bacterium]